MPRRGERDGFLITSATTSRTKEIRDKERRYVITMGIRALALVLGVLLFHGVAQVIAIFLAVVLPWVAVVVANAAPKISKHKPTPYTPREHVVQPLELGGPGEHRVVDAEFSSDRTRPESAA